ncbi:MAG: VOC family protein [Candidatus Brocadiia bacterium]
MNEPREDAPFPLKGVAQICIIVPDIDEAVTNWWEIFGVGPWHIYTYGRPLVTHMTRHGEPTDYRMKVALSYIGDTRVELIEPLEGDTVYAEFVEQHGYGIHHLGVLTGDMRASLEKAREAGFEMTMDGAGFGPDGDGHYAYLDTEKVIHTTLELIERPEGRHPPERIYPPQED